MIKKVCLCGSFRFYKKMLEIADYLTKTAKKISLQPTLNAETKKQSQAKPIGRR
jgi:hypothetical protein